MIGSMTSSLILIVLYLFFIGNSIIEGYKEVENITTLLNTWLVASFVSLTALTSVITPVSQIIRDRETDVIQDFESAGLSNMKINISYIFSATIVSFLMSLFSFLCSYPLILLNGGVFISLPKLLLCLILILLVSASSSIFIFSFVMFFKRSDTFSTFTTVISPLCGFITGNYVPIGELPAIVQKIVQAFPLTQGSILLRNVLVKEQIQALDINNSDQLTQFYFKLGIMNNLYGIKDNFILGVVYLVAGSIIFFLAIYTIEKCLIRKKNEVLL